MAKVPITTATTVQIGAVMITTKTLSASVETILPTSFFLDIYCSYLKLINLSLIFGMLMNIICCIKGIDNQSWKSCRK